VSQFDKYSVALYREEVNAEGMQGYRELWRGDRWVVAALDVGVVAVDDLTWTLTRMTRRGPVTQCRLPSYT
jgi:hypothetical protein